MTPSQVLFACAEQLDRGNTEVVFIHDLAAGAFPLAIEGARVVRTCDKQEVWTCPVAGVVRHVAGHVRTTSEVVAASSRMLGN